jgi:DNA replication protein DnaC
MDPTQIVKPPPIVVRAEGPHCRAEFRERDWTCPGCAGRGGRMEVDEEGYEVFVSCACRQAARRLQLFNAAAIGRRFATATLESYLARTVDQRRALQMANDFTLMYPKVAGGLLFWGPVGTGKTHLAIAMFRKLTLEKGVACRFVDYGNLLQDLRRSFAARDGDASLMLPLVEVELLVIDELGKGRGTEWEETVLDDLVSRRYNAGRTTLCTTNFDPSDRAPSEGSGINSRFDQSENNAARGRTPLLKERVGERIYSRLREMCEVVRVGGGDFRRTGQEVSRNTGPIRPRER